MSERRVSTKAERMRPVLDADENLSAESRDVLAIVLSAIYDAETGQVGPDDVHGVAGLVIEALEDSYATTPIVDALSEDADEPRREVVSVVTDALASEATGATATGYAAAVIEGLIGAFPDAADLPSAARAEGLYYDGFVAGAQWPRQPMNPAERFIGWRVSAADAVAEAEGRYWTPGGGGGAQSAQARIDGFVAGAAWASSRPTVEEAVEAAARAMWEAERPNNPWPESDDARGWGGLARRERALWLNRSRAALPHLPQHVRGA